MSETVPTYLRLKASVKAELDAIAADEDRSAASMANILLDLGIMVYRANKGRHTHVRVVGKKQGEQGSRP